MGCGSSSAAAAAGEVPEGYKALKVQSVVASAHDVKQLYTFDKLLGKGNFGIVHLVFDKKTNEKLACKSISKVGCDPAGGLSHVTFHAFESSRCCLHRLCAEKAAHA
jgi:hypothetical protein